MDELLLPLGYRRDRPQLEPNNHRVGVFTRTRGPTVDQIKVYGTCPFHGAFPVSELGLDLHFAQRSSGDPKQTAISSALILCICAPVRNCHRGKVNSPLGDARPSSCLARPGDRQNP